MTSQPMPEPAPPDPLRRLRAGVACFNRGEFFECHEILEAAWLEAAGDEKIFLQGLIQLAVSFHHLRRGNFAGAERLLRAAIGKLSSAASAPRPVRLCELLEAVRTLPEEMASGAAAAETPAPLLRMS